MYMSIYLQKELQLTGISVAPQRVSPLCGPRVDRQHLFVTRRRYDRVYVELVNNIFWLVPPSCTPNHPIS